MLDARQALRRLREGNERFVSNRTSAAASYATRRAGLVSGQEPFAIVLGCSDSRVPPELIFDQGLGDLFVIRVAANIATPSQVGSVELAASRFGTRLVVVLGHSQCSAVAVTLEELQGGATDASPAMRSIVDRIAPSVHPLLARGDDDPESLLRAAIRANVASSADSLRNGSEMLRHLVRDDGLTVVEAEYSLETGLVEFFEGTPEGSPV